MSSVFPTFEDAVRRIQKRDSEIHAFLSTRLPRAEAEKPDQEKKSSSLAGVPYSLKDVWEVGGEITTAGSVRYRDRISPIDSPPFAAFRAAGAVLLGKTSCSDLSIAPESVNYLTGPVCHPLDPSRTAGGSSGGAAAAVADRMSAFDWGTDIGGSIRVPAGFCGVFGLRLSGQTWPIHGLFPKPPEVLLGMLGQGPITGSLPLMREVLQAAAALKTGPSSDFHFKSVLLYEPDPRSLGLWPDFKRDLMAALVKAGIPFEENHSLPAISKIRATYDAVWGSHFQELFASDEFTLLESVLAIASAVLLRGRLGDQRLHPRTAGYLGAMALGSLLYRDKIKAVRQVSDYREKTEEVWNGGQLILMPTCAYPAPRHGGGTILRSRFLNCAIPGNLSDATALSIPFGKFPDGMPRALQIMGPPGSEVQVLDLAEKLQPPG